MKAFISMLIGLLVVGCGKKSPSVANKRTDTISQLEKEVGKPNLRSHVSAGISSQNKSRWHEILGTPQGTIPPDPGGKVIWVSNFDKALAEAKLSKRPILVTWRCLPCKQCAQFDKDILDGSPSLNPLLRRFMTVRMTDAALLDERYFPYKTHQDLDLSWWAYFLSSDGEYYGVFGGKDHVSDTTRISEAALVQTMKRILAHHYDPRRKQWGIDLPVGYASRNKSIPEDLRGYSLLKKIRPELNQPFQQHGACIHCHQVGDMLNLEAIDSGTFNIDQFTGQWPLPENVGILLERDDGLLVKNITPESPATLAGIRTGDRLLMANDMRLFSQADLRGVLHRLPHGEGSIRFAWLRNTQLMFGMITVQPDWRKTENYWRKTVYDGVYGPDMGFFPLKGPKAGKDQGLSIKPWMGNNPADRPVYKTGLRPQMEIVAINGMDRDMEARELIAWFRLNHRSGEEVIYKVRGGKEFKYVLPVD